MTHPLIAYRKLQSYLSIYTTPVIKGNHNDTDNRLYHIIHTLYYYIVCIYIFVTHTIRKHIPTQYQKNNLIENNYIHHSTTNQLNRLPVELVEHVLSYLHVTDLHNTLSVNKQLYHLSHTLLHCNTTYIQHCLSEYSWLQHTKSTWNNTQDAIQQLTDSHNTLATTYHGIEWQHVYKYLTDCTNLSNSIQQTISVLNNSVLCKYLQCTVQLNVVDQSEINNEFQHELQQYNILNKQYANIIILGLYTSLPQLLFKLLINRRDDMWTKICNIWIDASYRRMSVSEWTKTLLLPLYLLLDISLLQHSDTCKFSIKFHSVTHPTPHTSKSHAVLPFTLLAHFINNLKLHNSTIVDTDTFLCTIKPTLQYYADRISIVYENQLNDVQLATLERWKKGLY